MAIYTVVTGASSGIGKAIAEECAKRGRNLILVSLPEEGLADIRTHLCSRYNIEAEYYETDLTREGAVSAFYEWCQEKDLSIDMLVNNAGTGMQGKFEVSSHEKMQQMMQLNMNAIVSMCWEGLPYLKKQEKSYILNVGSIGAFTPVPYKAVYASTKHFVRTFTDALFYELKDTSVFVGCLCPGPTTTSKEHLAKIKEVGWVARLLTTSAEEVAARAIKGILNKERLIIPGIANKILVRLCKLFPVRLKLTLGSSAFENSSFNS